MIRSPSYIIRDENIQSVFPVSSLFSEAANGRINGYTTYKMYGTTTVAEYTYNVVSSWGNSFYQSNSATTLDVVSTSGFDTYGDLIGAREVTIYGYDGDFVGIEETVQLDGLTPVTTTNEFLRVLSSKVTLAAGGATNLGGISVMETGGSYNSSLIRTGEMTSRQAYTVVLPNTAFVLTDIHIGVRKSADANILVSLMTNNPYNTAAETQIEFLTDTSTSIKLSSPLVIPPQLAAYDVYFTGRTYNTQVTEIPYVSVLAEYMLISQNT